jgi:uncharacterized protein YecE (DUF72 family)
MSESPARVYVGTSGWKKPQWRGDFYPKGLVQRRELEFASRQLTSLEINATFHGLQRPSTFATWRNETPDDFVFAIKGHKAVTHTAHLRRARASLADFFASGVLRLDAKLGPLLWQFPPELELQLDEVAAFVSLLPRTVDDASSLAAESSTATDNPVEGAGGLPNRRIRHAIEVRNPSFLHPGFFELLRDNDIAAVFSNAPDLPTIVDLTSDFVYLRLSSGIDHYPDGYDDATLRSWAAHITDWRDGTPPRDVFAYFKNPAGVLTHTPHNALRLLEQLAGGAAHPVAGQHPAK